MSTTQKIKELLHQFEITVDLPDKILELEVKGDYTSCIKEEMTLDFINSSAQLDMAKFEVFLFEGDRYKCIIAPNNKYKMVSEYHKIKDIFVGVSYGFDGSITSRS